MAVINGPDALEYAAQLVDATLLVSHAARGYSRAAVPDDKGNRHNKKGRFTYSVPWKWIGEFRWRVSRGEPFGYSELHDALSIWQGDSNLEELMGSRTICRIAVRYTDGKTRSEYTLSGALAWPFALSRAIASIAPDDDDSLSARYADTRITALVVWVSDAKSAVKFR